MMHFVLEQKKFSWWFFFLSQFAMSFFILNLHLLLLMNVMFLLTFECLTSYVIEFLVNEAYITCYMIIKFATLMKAWSILHFIIPTSITLHKFILIALHYILSYYMYCLYLIGISNEKIYGINILLLSIFLKHMYTTPS
jgi:hypothetical protein